MRKLILLALLLVIFGATAPAPAAAAAAACSISNCGQPLDLSGTPLSVTQCYTIDGVDLTPDRAPVTDGILSGVIVQNIGSLPIDAFRVRFTSYNSSNSLLDSIEFFALPFAPYFGPNTDQARSDGNPFPMSHGATLNIINASSVGGGDGQVWSGSSLFTSTRDHVTCSVDGVEYSSGSTWIAAGAQPWPYSAPAYYGAYWGVSY